MITNNKSWSLGATPNKSLDQLAVFICSHSPSDLCDAGESARLHLKIFASRANFADVGFSFGFRIPGFRIWFASLPPCVNSCRQPTDELRSNPHISEAKRNFL